MYLHKNMIIIKKNAKQNTKIIKKMAAVKK